MRMDKNTIVIGIDHGWSQMKTANADVFTSGVREITTEPALFDNVLEYNGKYYKVGNDRLNVNGRNSAAGPSDCGNRQQGVFQFQGKGNAPKSVSPVCDRGGCIEMGTGSGKGD